MTGGHSWLEGIAHTEGTDDTMKEDGRLSHLCLLQFIVCSAEHDIGYAITENVVSLLKKFFCQWVVVVQVFTHTYKLSSLSGKYKCFHFSFLPYY